MITSFPIVNDGKIDGDGCSSGIVLVPITTLFAEGPRLIGVPDMTTAGAAGVIVWPLTTYCDALLAVTTSLPTVKPAGALGGSFTIFGDDPDPRPWFAGSKLRSG